MKLCNLIRLRHNFVRVLSQFQCELDRFSKSQRAGDDERYFLKKLSEVCVRVLEKTVQLHLHALEGVLAVVGVTSLRPDLAKEERSWALETPLSFLRTYHLVLASIYEEGRPTEDIEQLWKTYSEAKVDRKDKETAVSRPLVSTIRRPNALPIQTPCSCSKNQKSQPTPPTAPQANPQATNDTGSGSPGPVKTRYTGTASNISTHGTIEEDGSEEKIPGSGQEGGGKTEEVHQPASGEATGLQPYAHLAHLKPDTALTKAAFDANLQNLRKWGDAVGEARFVSRTQVDLMETFLTPLENYLRQSAILLELHQDFLQVYDGDVADVPDSVDVSVKDQAGEERTSTKQIRLQRRDFEIALRNAETALDAANVALDTAVAATGSRDETELLMSGANDGDRVSVCDMMENDRVLVSVRSADQFEDAMELRDVAGRDGVNPQLRARRDALDRVARVRRCMEDIESGVRPRMMGDDMPCLLPGDDQHDVVLAYRRQVDQFKETSLSSSLSGL